MPRRYTPRPRHRRFERGGELQDDVLGRGPAPDLDADRQTGGMHDERQRNRGNAQNVVRQRELTGAAKNLLDEIVHRHVAAPEIVRAPRLGDAGSRRRQPHVVPTEVAAELTPRRVDGGDGVEKLYWRHLPGVLVDLERHRLESLRTDRMPAPLRVALEPEIEAEEPHVG